MTGGRRITMVIDKGSGINATRDLIETQGRYVSMVKLGFGTALLTPEHVLREKINMLQSAGVIVFPGGTLWEAMFLRKEEDKYLRFIKELGISTIEISDGTIRLSPDEKARIIEKYARDFTVISEVGFKDERSMKPEEWAYRARTELNAGAQYIICEARESGTTGIYTREGAPKEEVVEAVLEAVPPERIIWEAPQKSQQVWFIKKLGPDVNLGNIPWGEAMAVEALRRGLRGDTMLDLWQSS